MWLQVMYLCEVFATLACIHSIYGKKVYWNVKPIALCLSLLVIYEVANRIQNGGMYSLIAFVPIFIYCRMTFKVSVMQIIFKWVWLIILLTSIEFLCILLVLNFKLESVIIRNAVASFITLLVTVIVLPRLHIDKLCVKGWLAKLLISGMVFILVILLLQGKFIDRINITLFVIVVPSILVLLYILVKWSSSQNEMEDIKREIELATKMEERYTELVDDIRIKQHGMKNHITAILSTHYTYKTYEKLVEVQDEYCNRLIQENRYSNLLQIRDKILIGYLYDKFCEMEADKVEVKYEIAVSIEEYAIPTFYLIEILGILLDNAVEAVKYGEKKIVNFMIKEKDSSYLFVVRNISKYVPYAEIENWFHKGISSKGKDRGLGLYHIKCLCQEFGCNICCRNVEYEQDNWIEFCLEIIKADSA